MSAVPPFVPDTRDWTVWSSPSIAHYEFLKENGMPMNPTDANMYLQSNAISLAAAQRRRVMQNPIPVDCTLCDTCMTIDQNRPPMPYEKPYPTMPSAFPSMKY